MNYFLKERTMIFVLQALGGSPKVTF